MPNPEFKHALIVGAGAGLSASLARALAQATRARAFACGASKPSDVKPLFGELDAAPRCPQ
jgi:hypothetical protein